MKPKPSNIYQWIKTFRESEELPVDECASILQISTEQYHAFEQGEFHLSLPELELLAVFLGIPAEVIFHQGNNEEHPLINLSVEKRSQFTSLANKYISSKLLFLIEGDNWNLETISEQTQLPLAVINAYIAGETPIPYDHLQSLCQLLSVPMGTFSSQTYLEDETSASSSDLVDKTSALDSEVEIDQQPQPELGEAYDRLIMAMKSLSPEEQVELIIMILEQFKNRI